MKASHDHEKCVCPAKFQITCKYYLSEYEGIGTKSTYYFPSLSFLPSNAVVSPRPEHIPVPATRI
jgi:hypothetical protein